MPEIDEQLGLLVAVAEAVLEDRHEPALRGLFGRDHRVDIFQRTDERLLADDVLAGLQGRHDLLEVQARRRADVDDVDRGIGEHLVERGGASGNAVGVADLGKAGFVQVADEGDVEQLLLLRIGLLDMGLADSEPDDGDVLHGHGAVLSVPGRWGRPSRPWPAPSSASSMDLKVRAWVIAVSVRFRTSAMSWRP